MDKKKETKLRKYMKVPINMVVKARDLYIRGMNQLSSHDLLGSGMGLGIPVCHVSTLPRSFSASHSQYSVRAEADHVAKLVRAASARNTMVDAQHGPPKIQKAKSTRNYGGDQGFERIDEQHGPPKMRKAKSTRNYGGEHGFERIDETSPLISFGSNHEMLQRSKSYSVVKYT